MAKAAPNPLGRPTPMPREIELKATPEQAAGVIYTAVKPPNPKLHTAKANSDAKK